MNLKKMINKLRNTHPELKDLNDKALKNWIEQRRDLDVCAICPDHARGLCCLGALEMPLPSLELCGKCTEYLRNKCEFDRSHLPKKSKILSIIMPDQPCKFLDFDTMLCKVYKDRSWKMRTCLEIKEAIKIGAVPRDCAYLSGKAKKKYGRGKIHMNEVKEKLCDWCLLTWDLTNKTPREGIYSLHKY